MTPGTLTAFDIESTGFDTWSKDFELVAYSFCWDPDECWVVGLCHPVVEYQQEWRRYAAQLATLCLPLRLAMHHGKYDCRGVQAATGIDLREAFVFDSQNAEFLLREFQDPEWGPKSALNLKDTAVRYKITDHPWKDMVDVGRLQEEPWADVVEYAGRDTLYLLPLVKRQAARLRKRDTEARLFSRLMMPLSKALVNVESNGIHLNEDEVRKNLRETIERQVEIENWIWEHWIQNTELDAEYFWTHYKRKTNKRIRPKWGPTSKFFHALMDHIGAEELETTPQGKASWNDQVMLTLAFEAEGEQRRTFELLLEHRRLDKSRGYMESWLAHAYDGRVYPSYRDSKVVTLRLSSSDPNIQQVTRTLKPSFGAPEGWAFIQADLSQIELRVVAHVAQDPVMLECYRRGIDLHRLMATRIVGCSMDEVTPEQRQYAKPVSFGFLYGMGPKKYMEQAFKDYGIRVTYEEAVRLRQTFFATYPAIGPWHEAIKTVAWNTNVIRAPHGLARKFHPHISDMADTHQYHSFNQAINHPIQSLASLLTLLAIIELERTLDASEARIVGTVHDSTMLQVRDSAVARLAPVIARAFLTGDTEQFGVKLSVPLAVDIEVSRAWGGPKLASKTYEGALP